MKTAQEIEGKLCKESSSQLTAGSVRVTGQLAH